MTYIFCSGMFMIKLTVLLKIARKLIFSTFDHRQNSFPNWGEIGNFLTKLNLLDNFSILYSTQQSINYIFKKLQKCTYIFLNYEVMTHLQCDVQRMYYWGSPSVSAQRSTLIPRNSSDSQTVETITRTAFPHCPTRR